MTVTRVPVFAMTLLACGSLSAQTGQSTTHGSAVVNKCIAADGTVTFSDEPCASSQKAQKVDTSAALRAGSGGNQEQMAASVADTDCRKRAHETAYAGMDAKIAESNRHIADYQQYQSAIAARRAYAPDGSGKVIDDPHFQQENAKYDAASATERDFQQKLQATTAANYQTAIKACEAEAAKSAPSQDAAKK
jgi:hypothetical protein